MIREIDKNLIRDLFISAAHHLDNNKQIINDLNVFPVPDGDTGTNMSMTMQAAEKALLSNELKSAGDVVNCVASATLRGARGNSGVILSQIMRGFASELNSNTVIYASDFVSALSSASKTAYRAVMKPTEGTILTVIRIIAETIDNLDEDDDIVSLFEAIVKAGNDALNQTPKMLPVLKKAGVVDAGGKGLMVIFEGMLCFLQNGLKIEEQVENNIVKSTSAIASVDDVNFGYCTEFIVRKNSQGKFGEILKSEINDQGDSVLVIDDDEIIKVHIHTDHPGIVLEKALSYGMLFDIKIDNLREQAEERMESQSMPEKEYGIIAVAAGDGITELMKEMGADVIVSGGQTMNPSAEDLLAAVNLVSAKKVFILPNNSNIVLTAEQAADMANKDVIVIKTKTIPQGIAALMAFDPKADDTEEMMRDAAAIVGTGQITTAVRDTEIDDIVIRKDNYLGLSEGKIITADEQENVVMEKILSSMIDEETISVTLLYGEGVEEENALKYEDYISKNWPDVETTVLYGGQPVYRYILSVE